jgi:hypothetical protein
MERIMRFVVVGVMAGAVVLAGAGMAAAKTIPVVATTPEAFAKLVTQLSAEGETYAETADDAAPAVSKAMSNVQYTADSVAELGKALAGIKASPLAKMYVTWNLLSPLKNAKDEVIAAFLDQLLALLKADCKYQDMPQLPQGALNALQTPANFRDAVAAKVVAKARADKAAKEQAVVKHNRMVNALEVTVKTLLALMAQTKADEALLDRFQAEVKDHLATYQESLTAIKEEALLMTQDRAKTYYDRMRKEVDPKQKKKEPFVVATKPEYKDTDNSQFGTVEAVLSADIATVVNVVCTSAREPAIVVPGAKPGTD